MICMVKEQLLHREGAGRWPVTCQIRECAKVQSARCARRTARRRTRLVKKSFLIALFGFVISPGVITALVLFTPETDPRAIVAAVVTVEVEKSAQDAVPMVK